jgi:hypothetical protein
MDDMNPVILIIRLRASPAYPVACPGGYEHPVAPQAAAHLLVFALEELCCMMSSSHDYITFRVRAERLLMRRSKARSNARSSGATRASMRISDLCGRVAFFTA